MSPGRGGWLLADLGAEAIRIERQSGGDDRFIAPIADERFATDTLRGTNGAELSTIFAEWCAIRPTEDVIAELSEAGIASGPVLRPEQVLDDPHVLFTGQLVDVSYPGLPRPARLADFPVALSETPGRIRGPAPTLGRGHG